MRIHKLDVTTGYSSAISRERALDFICDLLIVGVRVVSLKSSDAVITEEEIARLCHDRRAMAPKS